MNIIRHEINNPQELKQNDMVEIDVRLTDGYIMVTHDDTDSPALQWDLTGYLREAEKKDVQLVAANIKTDGGEKKIIETLENSNIPYFVFNMSRPTYIKYSELTNNIALPVSDYDAVSSLQYLKPGNKWIWLDSFHSDIEAQLNQYLELQLRKFFSENDKSVAVVAPDVHNHRELNAQFKELFKDYPNVYVCTNYPEDFA